MVWLKYNERSRATIKDLAVKQDSEERAKFGLIARTNCAPHAIKTCMIRTELVIMSVERGIRKYGWHLNQGTYPLVEQQSSRIM